MNWLTECQAESERCLLQKAGIRYNRLKPLVLMYNAFEDGMALW